MSKKTSTQSTAVVVAPADASCRYPLFLLIAAGAFWLILGSILTLIAAIKFHAPDFLAEPAWLTYGRVRPAGMNAILYGFCVPSALGLGLWLMAHLGRALLSGSVPAIFAGLLWNIGVAAGVTGILNGDSTGFEILEFPGYAAGMLFVAYLIFGVSGIITHSRRASRALFVSQWFLLAALFWFPWIYSSANLLVSVFPVRGMAQATVGWWYSSNLLLVWLGLVGLALAFYFLPRLSGRELDSHNLALFVFWMLILFGTWTGIPKSAPVPAWMPALSKVTTVMTGFAFVGVLLIVHRTLGGWYGLLAGDNSLLFVGFGLGAFILAGALSVVEALSGWGSMLHFTWFSAGRSWLNMYGYFSMILFGGIYFVLPRLIGGKLPFPKLVRLHFWLGAAGVLIATLPLIIGGVIQNAKLLDANLAFVDVAKSTLMFLRVSSIGDVLIIAGNVVFGLNVYALILGYFRNELRAGYAVATMEAQPEGAKS